MLFRGRLRWEKTQKKHQENLKQREINKQKRKEAAEQVGPKRMVDGQGRNRTFAYFTCMKVYK